MRVQGLTLNIIELPLFIIVFALNERRGSNNMLFEWLVLFEPFKLVKFIWEVVINLTKEAWILVKVLMPPVEGIVDVSSWLATVAWSRVEVGKTRE